MTTPVQGTTSNWNVPNALTVLRIVLVPVFAWLLLANLASPSMRWIADGVFILAILTDMADGKIARRYNPVSYTHLDVYKRQFQASLLWS